ncbi:MAG: hypothetical protein A3K60_05360 [Euryarchaeota archaeon RBG_19FT_COMBO_56_21]|nr:MAG: hypothetical protein A3K60_05360 [Euryarchaeota archaeon RBG_19FT_COMBO_56_21]
MVLVGFGSSVPVVSIAALESVDDGSTVETIGLVAEFWAWDDGTENLLLVETTSGCTVIIICSPGIHAQPGTYVHLGDEVKVVGKVFGLHSPRRLYSDSDRVTLLRRCEFVLTVDALANCWRLFEGDEIKVRGILFMTDGESGFALRGMMGGSTLSLDSTYEIQPTLLGREVVIAGCLVFEEATLTVVLHADSVVAS